MIVIKPLPHGAVPINGIKDPATRKAIMQANENVRSLSTQLVELQRAYLDMQRKKV